jgi:hypothetical protein
MTEKIATLTSGQHIIFGMVVSHFTNRLNLVFSTLNYGRLIDFIQEIDDPNVTDDLTYSEQMEEYPEAIPQIFDSIWERFEDVFLAIQKD